MSKVYVVFKTNLRGDFYKGELPRQFGFLANTLSKLGLQRLVDNGDTVHVLPIAFPQMSEWPMMDGSVLPITPAPKHWGPAV